MTIQNQIKTIKDTLRQGSYISEAAVSQRFASRKHGKKRRYIVQIREDWYPGRPDLAQEHSVEIIPGWWLGTNYSRSNIQQIIDLALEVAQPSLRSKIEANVL